MMSPKNLFSRQAQQPSGRAVRLTMAICLLIPCAANPLRAQQTLSTPTAKFFRDAAIADVQSAWSLLDRNHPGAAPEMHDTHFREMLDDARATAITRAARVETPEAYLAVMSGFSNMLDDKHLSFKPTLSIARPNWVGLLITHRNGEWIVADEDPWPGRSPLRGAALLSCDGEDVEKLARERLGQFRADWTIEAQRGLAAPWLLIDERNPFLAPIRQCTFSIQGRSRDVAMDWQPITRDLIITRINKAAGVGAAGFGVRRFGRGWWVAIGEFTANAPKVVAAAREQEAALRAAPYVVFDVRGNGGGSSDLGDQIAAAIYGEDVLKRDGNEDQGCATPWRVSVDNAARLASYPSLLGNRLSKQANDQINSDIEAMRAAIKAGNQFSRPIDHCKARKIVKPPTSSPHVYILTDRVCFSSCLVVVDTFRKLGATQIGEPTNANTRYQENRPEPLPSGLGTFSVQATVDLSRPPRVGPFLAQIRYPGDLTDTACVEAWMLKQVDRDYSPSETDGRASRRP